MNDVSDECGRPYGGVCIILRKGQLLYKEIECTNDRVITVAAYDQDNNPVQVLCNVYMPFYDRGNPNNTEQYVETIDEMQHLIDKYCSICPIKFYGDFNANVPATTPVNTKWYQCKGYNKHSLILYNFMLANDFIAVDKTCKQTVDYTFFCDKRKVTSWLDHVLCAQYDFSSIEKCVITNREADNDSDHLPIQTLFYVSSVSDVAYKAKMSHHNVSASQPSWKCPDVNAKYRTLLAEKLKSNGHLCVNKESSVESVQKEVDKYMDNLVKIIHDCANEAGCMKTNKFKPKAYWCPELTKLRDRKRFWWRLWNDADRPRSGALYDCYKGIKKMFRKQSRHCMNNMLEQGYNKYNDLYHNGRISALWRKIKNSRKCTVNSALNVESLASHYRNIMTDDEVYTEEQKVTNSTVEGWYKELASKGYVYQGVDETTVSELIDNLNNNCAPGIDGITGEHLKYGKSETLCSILSSLFTYLLSWQIVPHTFKVGVIVPVLKKPTLNPNDPANYRPITLSCALSKVMELLLLPKDNVSNTQFGFRKGRGTSFACTMFNDIKSYFEYKKSPLYACSLDAEKCFDSICHKSLFFKLWGKIPSEHWLLLYRWYGNLKAMVKWKYGFSNCFNVTKGTRQGSLLSPQLFNIFINDLLLELEESSHKVRIGSCSFNSFAYADDITLLCTTAPGLQCLINMCSSYARRWRFRFGINKTKCFIIAGNELCEEPRWHLNNELINNVDILEILGVQFDSKGESHVQNRSEKCRRQFYSLRDVGMGFPGCSSDVKSYVWRTMCQPVLTYGFDCLVMSKNSMRQLEKVQGNLIKQSLGLNKRSRNTHLLQALGIKRIEEIIKQNTASLIKRIYAVESPVRDLTSHFLSLFIIEGISFPGTIVERILSCGLSPTNCMFNKYMKPSQPDCGIVDSIRSLVMHENFIKPYTEQHVLCSLLTRAF